MSISEFLEKYGNGKLLRQLKEVEGLPPQEQYKKTLETVWGFEDYTAPATSLINTMVFLDPDGVAESLLEQAFPDMVVDIHPQPGDKFIQARTELSSTSLIKRNIKIKTLSWHRLVQEVAEEKMTNVDLERYFQFAVQLLYNAWKFTKDRFNRESFRRDECEKIIPHIDIILRHYHEHRSISGLPIELAKLLVHLLQEAGWYVKCRFTTINCLRLEVLSARCELCPCWPDARNGYGNLRAAQG